MRGLDGEARAFYNLCRHRGARLCMETAGSLPGGIRCPYHAWRYDLNGALRAAPFMEDAAGLDLAALALHPVRTAQWQGFLFCTLNPDAPPFEESRRALLGNFDAYQIPHLECARRIPYVVQANWKLLFENYSECCHCPSVHPALVRLSPADSGRNDLTCGPVLGGYTEMREGVESMTVSGRMCGRPVGPLPTEELHRVYYYSLFPNMLLSLHPDYVMTHLLWPEGPGRTRVQCEWLFSAESERDRGWNPDDAVEFWDRTNREDWAMCERSQLGVASRAYRPGPYSPRESVSAAFDQEYLREMDKDLGATVIRASGSD